MKDQSKTKQVLIQELVSLRQVIAEHEQSQLERKEAERILRLSEEKYRILFETMHQGVIYHDPSGQIIAANSAAERILGLTIDEIITRATIDTRWQVIHEDGSEFPAETRPSWVALKTGKPLNDVVMGVFNSTENQYRWIIVNAVPLFRFEECKPFMVHTTFTDITEHKKTEKTLRQYSDRLKVLHEIDRAILTAQTPEVIAQNTLNQFRKLIPYTRASIVLFDLIAKNARVVGVDVSGETHLGLGTLLSLDLFGNIEEFALGKINFVHDTNTISHSSPEIQLLKAEGIYSYINIPMICQGELVGSLNLGFETPDLFTNQYEDIAREVSDSISVALQNAQLLDEVRQNQKDLQRLSSHTIAAQEAERKRIAMELHDEMGQTMTAMSINLAVIEKELSLENIQKVKEKLADTRLLVDHTSDQIRELSLDLRPAMLDYLGLVPTLR